MSQAASTYDADAVPAPWDVQVPTDAEQVELREAMYSLQRIAHAKAALDAQRASLLAVALPMLRRFGRPVALVNPVTGQPQVANLRQDETLEVDYDGLVKAVGVRLANSMCKPRVVDTKDGGLFDQAQQAGLITAAQVGKLTRLIPKAAYIGFNHPSVRRVRTIGS